MEKLPKLDSIAVAKLTGGKNLLAFSGGVDSSALFFLLLHNDIDFDIAIVDYNLRASSALEVEYAKELAVQYGKKIFIANAPKFESSFESNARNFRYSFFDDIIKTDSYSNLITAHQLNDKLEWFLMRFCKGAGIQEMIGMRTIQERKNYFIIRPMLQISKEELELFLNTHNIKHFIDETNLEPKYERNRFRLNYANEMIKNFKSGIKKSFTILENQTNIEKILNIQNLYICESSPDKALKQLGYVASYEQRQQFTSSCVLGGKFAIDYDINNICFVAPYLKIAMDKYFKEKCRVLNIPPKIRGYLFDAKIAPEQVDNLRQEILKRQAF